MEDNLIGLTEVPANLKQSGLTQKHWDTLRNICIGPDGIAVGTYAKSYDFLINIKDRKADSLTEAQRKWLTDIINQMNDFLETDPDLAEPADKQDKKPAKATKQKEKPSHINNLKAELYDIVNSISTDSIREFTKQMLKYAPEASWARRASKNHHLEDERVEGGNLLHTIRVAKTVVILCDACDYGQTSRDIMLSAAVIHDMFRYGAKGESDFTVDEHPLIPVEVAVEHKIESPYRDIILKAVVYHMGKYGPRPVIPQLTTLDILLVADAVNAKLDVIL